MQAFISHISEESKVAIKLKEALDQHFLGLLKVFVSSDNESIAAGEEWLKAIDEALHNTNLLIILCSPISIRRPWINFEAGAAWMLKIPIIPICHAGLLPNDLLMPLSLRQGLLLDNVEHLTRLYKRIADILNCNVPLAPFEQLAKQLSELENSPSSDLQKESRQLDRERDIRKRLREALNHPGYKWRSIESVAFAGGITKEEATDFLRSYDDVVFGKGTSGKTIVGLQNRVR